MNGKILILGSKGMLGGELLKVFGSEVVGWDREECDVTNVESLKLKIESLKPSVILNCVAYNDVDGAEENQELANKLNVDLPKILSGLCKQLPAILVHFSSNYVFDGSLNEYSEADTPNPISVYGRTKYDGEKIILNSGVNFYIIRTAVLFGEAGKSQLSKKSFVSLMLDKAKETDTIKVVADEVNSLTFVKDLALAVKVLLSQQFSFGIYHFTNLGSASWYDFAKEIFKISKLNINLVPISSSELSRKAKRPKKAVLSNTKFIEFRPWQEALSEFLISNL